ncbi:hypothetical protein JA33_027 [Dickeya phage vB_DsoM_JA33]|uniref:Uncharacterized protein n=3 Tax=Salmondvirus JA11 TaxID=2734141 RepID=A0A384ZW08_9CAUD|nr:hypothetical protein HOU32_gp027 [Dickeya phage vB_DsoM_JA11]AXG66431.1 hypothetical protein JA13_028 [Dickeya phage vB_DsoM_JA13]AXG67401.1 hypothetical protein JA33_027 [Dickeya phage vB_DsoM_JA33]AYD79832.1 hypothetical protein JA11_027 [Dickeya phage vB_DsoM_JA11]
MFKYPFKILGVEAIGTQGRAEIYTESLVPAIGSIVPLDLHPFAQHGLWFVTGCENGAIQIATYRIQIDDPFALVKFINSGLVQNKDADNRRVMISKFTHEFVNELARAEKKFPNWNKDAVYAASIMGEESGETLQAALDYQQAPAHSDELKAKILLEAIQTGAMALRLLINGDSFEHDSKSFSVAEVDSIRKMLELQLDPAEIVSFIKDLIQEKG